MKALKNLFDRLHRDERGAVSLETILIIGAIAIPILFFLLKVGWPKIRDLFNTGFDQLKGEAEGVTTDSTTTTTSP